MKTIYLEISDNCQGWIYSLWNVTQATRKRRFKNIDLVVILEKGKKSHIYSIVEKFAHPITSNPNKKIILDQTPFALFCDGSNNAAMVLHVSRSCCKLKICNATPRWTGLTENENIICEKCLFTHFMPLVSFYIPCKHQKTSGENKFGWKCYYKTKPFRGLFEEFCTQSYILHLKARTKTLLLEKIKFFANIR